jgi:hypothetical protein
MPLRREVRKLYNTAAYRRERREVIAREGAWCKRCGRPHPRLNLAHLSHDPQDRAHRELLCPSCHSKNDTAQRIAMTRRAKAQKSGQQWISAEVRLAPYPLRTWPARVRQMELF